MGGAAGVGAGPLPKLVLGTVLYGIGFNVWYTDSTQLPGYWEIAAFVFNPEAQS